jgi:hypothetical protein
MSGTTVTIAPDVSLSHCYQQVFFNEKEQASGLQHRGAASRRA